MTSATCLLAENVLLPGFSRSGEGIAFSFVLILVIHRLYVIEAPCLKERSLTSEGKAYGVQFQEPALDYFFLATSYLIQNLEDRL